MSDLTTRPIVREAIFYEKLKNGKIKCSVCERRCEIPQSAKGFCRTRVNIDSEDAQERAKHAIYNGCYECKDLESDPVINWAEPQNE